MFKCVIYIYLLYTFKLCRFTNNILSTLQQVWLQKLGGAKNPLGQVLDDNVKNDPMPIQKSVSKLNSTKVEEPRKGEKLTSEGPRPGDRLVIIIVGSYTFFIMLLIYFNQL